MFLVYARMGNNWVMAVLGKVSFSSSICGVKRKKQKGRKTKPQTKILRLYLIFLIPQKPLKETN